MVIPAIITVKHFYYLCAKERNGGQQVKDWLVWFLMLHHYRERTNSDLHSLPHC